MILPNWEDSLCTDSIITSGSDLAIDGIDYVTWIGNAYSIYWQSVLRDAHAHICSSLYQALLFLLASPSQKRAWSLFPGLNNALMGQNG